MYRMGLMALIANDTPGVNRDKLVFDIYELWMEYKENSTTGPKVVKNFDKV
ncbi:putative 5'-deoxynucleotidase YfbR/HDDC2 [Helianthus anomalus]